MPSRVRPADTRPKTGSKQEAAPWRPSRNPSAPTPAPRLARGALSLFDTLSSTLANLAPVEGIFLSITLVVVAMGSQAPWAFLVAGVAILATGNTMSEFSQTIPSAGSFVTFIGRGFGSRAPKTGSALAGLAYYLLMICYPVTVAAVVVFMGSWVAALFNWGNAGWLAVTLVGVALAVPLLLRGVVISARASFIMFCSEALGLIILSIVVLSLVHGNHLSAPFHANGGSPGGFRGLVGLTFALAVTGVNFLGSFNEAAPFLDLSRHFSRWFDWFIGLVGFTSSFGCFIAAANSQTRITFNGARAGLLPPRMATVSRTKVPWASVFIYTGLTVLLVVIPYFTMHGNAVSIFSDEAGIGTVPILIVYLLANIALPLHVLATGRAAFSPVKHVLIPLIGSAVLVYGVYKFVQPGQPAPANVFWAWILGIVALSAIATAIVYVRRPDALSRAGTTGPELVIEDAR